MIRVGLGFDVHALVPGRRCVIGGVEIAHAEGLLGHSDADVLLHAITDAVLGAADWATSVHGFPTATNATLAPTAGRCSRRPGRRCGRRDGVWGTSTRW